MKTSKTFLFLLLVCFVTTCTRTRVVSFTDPDAEGRIFNRIAVLADVADLSDQQTMETKIVETLRDHGVYAIPSIELLPPTREFTIEQENEIFREHNIDALLILQISDTGFYNETESMRVHTNSDSEGSETTVSGGGVDQKAFGQFRVTLIDLASDKKMWIGDADTHTIFDFDEPDMDMRSVLKGSSKKIAEELVKTGLVRTSK